MEKDNKSKPKRKKSQRIIDGVIVLIIIALLGTAAWLLYQAIFPNNVPIIKQEVMGKDDVIDWDQLKAKNPDTVGWLFISGTNIDTPIVQTVDNDRYLNMSFDGRFDERGVPFLDYEYPWDPPGRNAVIYGHSSMDPTFNVMFDDLLKYVKDPEFIKKFGEIIYKRPPEYGGDAKYIIFAVLVQESDYDYRQINFTTEDEFLAYFDRIKMNSSVVRDDLQVQPGDEILTLSTCIFNTGLQDGRLAIIAKQVK